MLRLPFSVAIMLGTVLFLSCDNLPTRPTPSSDRSDKSPLEKAWSPYVVIHAHGGSVAGQNFALKKLAAAGNLEGIRIGTDSRGEYQYFLGSFIQGLNNIDILGVVETRDFMDPNVEEIMDKIYTMYPEVKYFQIGNEYMIPEINNGRAIDPKTYMERFKRVYDHTIKRHSRIKLVAAATISGPGPGGAEALAEMGELGLNKMDPSRVILSMNIYDVGSASAYVPVLAKFPGFEVFITESGSDEPKNHIEHVLTVYPAIGSMLHAKRIYWYSLWEGDGEPGAKPEHLGFGLIIKPWTQEIIERDLFKALTLKGGVQ